MIAESSYAALRSFNRTTTALLADPQVTGDLLLIGMWLARAAHLHLPAPATGDGHSTWQLPDIAADLFPLHITQASTFNGQVEGSATEPDWRRVFEVLKNDIRRYDAKADQPFPPWARPRCSGPMVRRVDCGKPSFTWAYLTVLETGRKRMVGACRKHHDWLLNERSANAEAVKAAEVPRPHANVGGLLAPHFPDIDWPALWVGLDPTWTAPPEVLTSARPKLRVVLGTVAAADLSARPARQSRPRFALIDGALT